MSLSEKGIIIRETVESDLRQIYLLGNDEHSFISLSFRMSPENLADIFASDNTIQLTAARKKKVLGFIIGSISDKDSLIHWMGVKPEFLKTEIRVELLKSFILKSKKSSAVNFIFAVSDTSPETLKFFIDNGFTVKRTLIELHKDT